LVQTRREDSEERRMATVVAGYWELLSVGWEEGN